MCLTNQSKNKRLLNQSLMKRETQSLKRRFFQRNYHSILSLRKLYVSHAFIITKCHDLVAIWLYVLSTAHVSSKKLSMLVYTIFFRLMRRLKSQRTRWTHTTSISWNTRIKWRLKAKPTLNIQKYGKKSSLLHLSHALLSSLFA